MLYMGHTVELIEARDMRIDKLGLTTDDSFLREIPIGDSKYA